MPKSRSFLKRGSCAFTDKVVKAAATPKKFVSRNLAGASPLKEQFEPTEATPVPQMYKMAGGA